MPKTLLVSSNDDVSWVFNLQDIDPDDPDMRLFLSMGVGVDGAVKHVSKKKQGKDTGLMISIQKELFTKKKKHCWFFLNNQSLSNYKQFVMKQENSKCTLSVYPILRARKMYYNMYNCVNVIVFMCFITCLLGFFCPVQGTSSGKLKATTSKTLRQT